MVAVQPPGSVERSVAIVTSAQTSVAVALASQAVNASAVPASPQVTLIGSGTVNVGSVVSTMVNLAESLADASQLSVTVQVTVTDPDAPHAGLSALKSLVSVAPPQPS